jgi:TRAP-type C4-dicarboxylate transport system permease small subunit
MRQLSKLIDKTQKFNRALSNVIEAIGVVSLLLIMVITCADVIGAKVFLKPVPGSLDIVMMAQTVAIAFSAAATLSAGGHVSVEIFLMHMPPLMKRATIIVTEMLSLVLFVLIVWQLAVYGHELKFYGETSPTAHIPLYPFAYGIALATAPACIELGARIIKIFLGEDPA